MEYNLDSLIRYWRTVFESENPIRFLHQNERWSEVPKNIFNRFDLTYYPEPFYGYLDRDCSEDALLLLINPGEVPDSDLVSRYPSPGGDKEASKALWNADVRQRYLGWTPEQFHAKEPIGWRETRRKQAQTIVGERVPFLHTIEFFPFHSKNWTVHLNEQRSWIYNLESTRHSLGAIRHMAETKKVKFIFGIGNTWKHIIEAGNDIFEFDDVAEIEIWRPGKTKPSFEIAMYRKNDGSLPIVITRLGGNHMYLPTDPTAIMAIRSLYRNGEIPPEHNGSTIRANRRKLG